MDTDPFSTQISLKFDMCAPSEVVNSDNDSFDSFNSNIYQQSVKNDDSFREKTDEDDTRYRKNDKVSLVSMPVARSSRSSVQSDTTVIDLPTNTNIQPVLSWLVCIKGPDYGKSFRIAQDVCTVGRPRSTDGAKFGINLTAQSISRISSVFNITYNQRNFKFYITKSSGHPANVYVNENLVLAPMELHYQDVIEITAPGGSETFIFIPFCGEKFAWKKETPEHNTQPVDQNNRFVSRQPVIPPAPINDPNGETITDANFPPIPNDPDGATLDGDHSHSPNNPFDDPNNNLNDGTPPQNYPLEGPTVIV